MKKILFIVLAISVSVAAASAQSKKRQTKKPKKQRGSYNQLPSNTNAKLEGPTVVNVSTLIYKEDTSKNNYHNEQDNFKQDPNRPTNPAPITPNALEGNPAPTIVTPDANKEVLKKTRATPALASGFDAEICSSNIPPDNSMAISNAGKIVSAVNCGIFFYSANGTSLGSANYGSFFNTSLTGFSDPRVLYDVYTDRFIVLMQLGFSPSTSKLYIAFSQSNDPLGSWNVYTIAANSLSAGNWFDYPSVGINQNDFCVSGNMFNSSNTSADNSIMIVDKAAGYAGNTPAIKTWNNVQDGNGNKSFTITPASAGRNVTYSNTFHLIATRSGGGSYVTKYTITGKATDTAPTLTATDVNTSQQYYPSATAVQPNGVDLANYKAGCRVQAAIFVDNTILFVYPANYNDGTNDFNSIYYNALNVNTNVMTQSWSYLTGSSYNYPCLASFGNSNTDKAVILGFLKSDASTNAEIRFKYFDNNLAQLGSVQARKGDDAVYYSWASEQRWGDYIGMQMKYNATSSEAWMGGSFGNANQKWQTFIGKITGYPGAVPIQEIKLNELVVNTYPNPVQSMLNISGDFSAYKLFPKVFSVDGKIVNVDISRRNNNLFQIDVNGVVAGNYYIKFEDNKVIKFVKN
jgi:Secretion system C-terminal sorting domain